MAKLIYPIILHPEKDGGYSVNVPDLNIGTQGETVAECIDMARDAIGLWGICEQDAKRQIPEPSNLTPTHGADEIVTLVDIDFDAYRRTNDLRAVRKNVTLPSWPCHLAEEAGVNFSQVPQEGLKARLHVTIVNVIYPGIFHHEDGSYWIEFPDLNGCQSFGDTIEETFSAAKEALSAYCAALLEIGKQLPKASDIESLCIPENAFPALIETTVTAKEAEE